MAAVLGATSSVRGSSRRKEQSQLVMVPRPTRLVPILGGRHDRCNRWHGDGGSIGGSKCGTKLNQF